MTDTIFGLSSGTLPAGIGIVRISGPGVVDIAKGMLSNVPPPRYAKLSDIRDPFTREIIDRGLALFFPKSHSFTGEPVLELQLHGGRAIIARCFECLEKFHDCRPALAGEFTRRAFLNQKLDLLEAEGLMELISANTESQRRQAVAQSSGSLSRQIGTWRSHLLQASALLAAILDFADEGDVDENSIQAAVELVERVNSGIQQAIRDFDRAEIVRDGFTVLLAGPPNAGKSTLLNALANRDVAIVSPHAGTTRDLIEVSLNLKGLPVVIIDSAGIRVTNDPIERIGIDRSLERAQHSHLVLWLSDRDELPPMALNHSIRVRTKSDIFGNGNSISISASSGAGIDALLEMVHSKAQSAIGAEVALISNLRQLSQLKRAISFLSPITPAMPVEIVADSVRCSLGCLSELVGRIDAEEVLDAVFSRFCIGK